MGRFRGNGTVPITARNFYRVAGGYLVRICRLFTDCLHPSGIRFDNTPFHDPKRAHRGGYNKTTEIVILNCNKKAPAI